MKNTASDSERGILYIAFGESFVREAILSAECLKLHFPGVPVTLFTDQTGLESPLIDTVRIIEPQHMRSKVDFMSETPYRDTLYLDSDAFVVHPLDDVFELLDRFDIAFTTDLARKRLYFSEDVPEYKEIPYSFSEANSGVICFRKNNRTEQLWKLWQKYFYQYKEVTPYDQMSFRIALWESDVKIHWLPVEYNIRSKQNREKQRQYQDRLGIDHMKPRIFHMHCDPDIYKGSYSVTTVEEALSYFDEHALPY